MLKSKKVVIAIIILILLVLMYVFVLINHDSNKIKEKKDVKQETKKVREGGTKNNITTDDDTKYEIQVGENNYSGIETNDNVPSKKTENKVVIQTPNVIEKSSSNNINNGTNNNLQKTETKNNTDSTVSDNSNVDLNAVDTKHILYPSHHGQIDYKDLNSCNNGGFERQDNDSSILSFSCIEVYSVGGSVLGYYLELHY